MRKCINSLMICLLIPAVIWFGALLSDRKTLRENLIRLHVVAASDSREDQQIKLKVRDAVLQSIQEDLGKIQDVEEAKAYLRHNIPKIRETANRVLAQAGVDCETVVTLCRETFPVRIYDTFTLPSGIYESLRIVIGEGEGQNWWCVAFPSLCVPDTVETFEDAAVEAGLSQSLTDTLSREQDYEIRFYLLDKLGQLENILMGG